MSVPRKHHWLPKMFLAPWTSDGTVDGQLQVLDKESARRWSARPVNAAVERDLYMINLAGVTDDITATEIEDTFATIEGSAAPVLGSVLNGDGMPSGEDRENLIALIAILTIRVPSRLAWLDSVMRAPVELTYRRLEAAGKLPQPDDPALAAKMKEWFDQGLIKIKIKQNARLAMMVSMLPTLMDLLMRRHWTVVRVSDDAGDLICGDHPVLLEWIKQAPEGTSPGFGMDNTAVFVPIGPATGLLGLWNAEPKTDRLTAKQVSFWNGQLLGHVSRFAFFRRDFVALHRSGAQDSSAEVLQRWQESASNK